MATVQNADTSCDRRPLPASRSSRDGTFGPSHPVGHAKGGGRRARRRSGDRPPDVAADRVGAPRRLGASLRTGHPLPSRRRRSQRARVPAQARVPRSAGPLGERPGGRGRAPALAGRERRSRASRRRRNRPARGRRRRLPRRPAGRRRPARRRRLPGARRGGARRTPRPVASLRLAARPRLRGRRQARRGASLPRTPAADRSAGRGGGADAHAAAPGQPQASRRVAGVRALPEQAGGRPGGRAAGGDARPGGHRAPGRRRGERGRSRAGG